MITISIVSHNHGEMVSSLVKRLLEYPLISRIIVTFNLPECISLQFDYRVLYLYNPEPIGFGANHNKAFAHSNADYFVVLNPDVILTSDPFPKLLKYLNDREEIAIVAPLALSLEYVPDDNWRKFPTIFSLTKKFLFGYRGTYNFSFNGDAFPVDWASGCFLLIKSSVFKEVNGFDESYFMYYEDVDICFRVSLTGFTTYAYPQATFIHDARRASRKNIRHMKWHARGLIKFQIRFMKFQVRNVFSKIWPQDK